MSDTSELKSIFAAGRPLVEQSLDIAEQIAALRDVATEKGFEWSQIKALLKAQVQDERDGKDRVAAILEKASYAAAYADMLGLSLDAKIMAAPSIADVAEAHAGEA